jgi:hypothetical protein
VTSSLLTREGLDLNRIMDAIAAQRMKVPPVGEVMRG